MDSSKPHRIDPPNRTISGPVRKRRHCERVAASATVSQSDKNREPTPTILDRQEAWLELQATDLIGQLQTWSAQLDARESQLNVRASLQDSRERQFRLYQQDALVQQAEQQRAIQRLQREIEAQARRLAFQQD